MKLTEQEEKQELVTALYNYSMLAEVIASHLAKYYPEKEYHQHYEQEATDSWMIKNEVQND